jgi:hypothetical protein
MKKSETVWRIEPFWGKWKSGLLSRLNAHFKKEFASADFS